MADARVQAPELGITPLQGGRAAPDTFVQAARAPVDNTLGSLADALGSFNSNLKSFGTAYATAQRPDQTAQRQKIEDAKQWAATTSQEDILAADKAGTIKWSDYDKAKLYQEGVVGQAMAHQLAQQYQEKVKTGELTPDQGPTWLQSQYDAITKADGWDQTNGKARTFGEGFKNLFSQAHSGQVNYLAEQTKQQSEQAYSDRLGMTLDAARSQHLTPEQTWDLLNKDQNEQKPFIGIDNSRRDQLLMTRLATYGDPQWALGIAGVQRKDVKTGDPVPSLASKPDYLTTVSAWQTHAHTQAVKAAEAEGKASVATEVVKAFQTDPASINNLPSKIGYTNSVAGTTGEVSKETALKAAMDATIQRDQQRVQSGQATPAQIMDEQLNSFALSGQKHPVWEQTLKAAAHGAANPQSLTDPKQQQQTLDAFGLWKNLYAKNPTYAASIVDGKTLSFMNTAVVQQQLFHRSDLEAMQAAQQIWGQPKSEEENKALAQQHQNLVTQAHNAVSGLTDWTGKGSTIHNPEVASQAVADAAWGLVRLNHMKPEDAVSKAKDIAMAHFVNVNGSLVPDMGYLPKEQMQPAAEGWIKSWAEGPAKNFLTAKGMSASDVTIAPAGDGRFMIVNASDGMPIQAPRTGGRAGGFTYLTANELIESAKTVAKQQQEAAPGFFERLFGGTTKQTTDEAVSAASSKIKQKQGDLQDINDAWTRAGKRLSR